MMSYKRLLPQDEYCLVGFVDCPAVLNFGFAPRNPR